MKLIAIKSQRWALYGANDRSPRIRANTGEFARIRREFARIRRLFANFLFPRTLANDWRTLRELPRTLAEFARIRPNSRGVRRELANSSPKKCFYLTFSNFLANYCSPRTIVRREQSSLMKLFAANDILANEFTTREQSFAKNSK